MLRKLLQRAVRWSRAARSCVMAAALIAALLLSLLVNLFYNAWIYEIERIILEEGAWQGRIVGALTEQDAESIRRFPNVKSAECNTALSNANRTVIDLTFYDRGAIYRDLPVIAARAGLTEDAVSYHELLLSRYLVHDPADAEPPLLMGFLLLLLLTACAALVLIIHNAFAVAMNAELRILGTLSGVGAAPRQIRFALMHKAAAVCTLPVLAGNLAGAGFAALFIALANRYGADMAGRHAAAFRFHPLPILVSLFAAAATVAVSAYLPARKLGKISPLTAMRYEGDTTAVRRVRRRTPLKLLFGVEGMLADRAVAAQKKALRTGTLSLALSYLGFTVMLAFTTLSSISTEQTYFARYQDAWDVMVTIPNADPADFALAETVRNFVGVQDALVYSKTETACLLPDKEVSAEGDAFAAQDEGASRSARTTLVVLDDAAYLAYCSKIGVPQQLDGAVVINRIWDGVSSHRNKEYAAVLDESAKMLQLKNEDGADCILPVLAYADETPVLRETFGEESLTAFLPVSLWQKLPAPEGGVDAQAYLSVLAENRTDVTELDALEERILTALGTERAFEGENRIREKTENDKMIKGLELAFGTLCALLAVIGLASVFSHTMGFVLQRRSEFVRYLSIGVTPKGLNKIFCAEALAVAGRPILYALLLTIAVVFAMLKLSAVPVGTFLKRAPIAPALVFALADAALVALAYSIGAKKVLQSDLIAALRSDRY